MNKFESAILSLEKEDFGAVQLNLINTFNGIQAAQSLAQVDDCTHAFLRFLELYKAIKEKTQHRKVVPFKTNLKSLMCLRHTAATAHHKAGE
jgi:hypothetical protein